MQRSIFSSIGLGIAVLGIAAVSLAQSVGGGKEAMSHPDLRGIWTQGGNVGFDGNAGEDAAARDIAAGRIPRFAFAQEEPPMQPWALERYKVVREGMHTGEVGRNERAYILFPYCLPEGMPKLMTIGTFEILDGKNIIYLLNERNQNVRRIYLDGKRHLEGMAPTFLGTSYGRWDGDTLFVETSNIDSLDSYAWLDSFGHPMTNKLRVEERFRRIAQDKLRVDFVFDDPGAYTRPWNGIKVYVTEEDRDLTENITCSDHLREEFVRDMKSGNYRGRP
jgi:hypothetical protein